MKNKKILLAVAMLIATDFAEAQKKDDNLGDEQVVIEKGYKPVIADAVKASDAPQRDTVTQSIAKITYSIDPVVASTNFTLAPIKPVKVKDENIKELYRGFIKGGYGTQATPYAEIFYNALRSKEFNAGIHLKHLSSKGKISGYGYPDNSNNFAELFGRKYFDGAVLGAMLGYNRDVFHYYGYDAEMQKLSKGQTKTTLNDIYGQLNYKGLFTSEDDLQYDFNVGYYYAKDDFENKEGDFNATISMGKKFGMGKLHGKLLADFAKLQQSYGDFNNGLVSIEPRYNLIFDPWNIDAGFNLQFESLTDSAVAHFYPFVKLDYDLGEKAAAYAEFSGGIAKNSFRNTFYTNPFLADIFGIANTNNKINFLFGLNFNFDQHYFVNAEVNYRQFKNEQYFLNTSKSIYVDTIGYDVTAFSPVYYDGNVLKLHGEIGYQQENKLEVKLQANYFKYNLNENAEPWHTPLIEVGLNANYNLGEKIVIKADLFIHGATRYYDYSKNDNGTLKPITDINLGVDYRYTKVMSFWCQLNNVAFQKYQQWYNYPSYKINALLGFSYSF